jgi:hypothetical protein
MSINFGALLGSTDLTKRLLKLNILPNTGFVQTIQPGAEGGFQLTGL